MLYPSSPSFNDVRLYLSLCRKVNSFLDKMNPTEEQMASYIDTMREKQWPEVPRAAPSAPRTEEEKSESRERAHNLISAKCKPPLCCLGGNSFFFLQILYSISTVSMTFFCLSVDSNYLVLKKTDMDSVFNLFQDREENKTLVYVSISTFDLCRPRLVFWL